MIRRKIRNGLCQCGCGEEVRLGNRFILGHNAKINPPIPKKINPEPKLCKCGCGNYAKSNKEYIWGHNTLVYNPMALLEARNKYKQTMLQRYGVDNNMKLPEFHQKVVKKRRSKKHYQLGDNVTLERIKQLKEQCSKAGKIGGASRAKFWKENPREFQKFLERSHDPMVTGSYSGSNHPCWNNGSSLNGYCGSWQDNEYKEDIKIRDEFKCQNSDCWKTSKELLIHHIDYDKKNCFPDNLITICRSCHSRIHFSNNKEFWKNFYANAIKKEKRNE